MIDVEKVESYGSLSACLMETISLRFATGGDRQDFYEANNGRSSVYAKVAYIAYCMWNTAAEHHGGFFYGGVDMDKACSKAAELFIAGTPISDIVAGSIRYALGN